MGEGSERVSQFHGLQQAIHRIVVMVGSHHEEHRTKVNDLWTTSMHSECMVRPSPRRSSVHMKVLGEVSSLVYTQAINRCGFSLRGTHLVDYDQGSST